MADAVTCKIVQMPKTIEETQKFWEDFGPILLQHWDSETERTGDVHDCDVFALNRVWEAKGLIFLAAYQGENIVGFMWTYVFKPIMLTHLAFTIERWEGTNNDVVDAMFKYMFKFAFPAYAAEHINIAAPVNKFIPSWIKQDSKDTYTMIRARM